ncbi:hypothetical protein [Bacillus cereus group sp. BfR-BA-01356]|uniref:hypothetical protein n=1 Tax=Bacillus cereus group sp. BfR-BA-01356 TaxID=2920319 RepID=UPI001F58AAC0
MKDLYNNEIVAYHISHRHDIQLVIDTLNKAKKQRNVCKCQDKHVHFRLFKHVQNQSFSLLK